MATIHLIPVSEYLNSSYRPDVDFVEGALEERILGERHHGRLQLFFAVLFSSPRHDFRVLDEG